MKHEFLSEIPLESGRQAQKVEKLESVAPKHLFTPLLDAPSASLARSQGALYSILNRVEIDDLESHVGTDKTARGSKGFFGSAAGEKKKKHSLLNLGLDYR